MLKVLPRLVFTVFTSLSILLLTSAHTAFAVPQTEEVTGLTIDAPKKFLVGYDDATGLYTIRKKKSKTRAELLIGTSPLTLQQTADDFISSSGMKVKKYLEQGDSILLKGKLGKKSAQIRFKQSGSELEVIRYYGKKKKKKKKKKRNSRRSTLYPRLTAAQVRLLDRILATRQGGRIVPLPVTIPTQTLRGTDGTSALVPNLPGWSFDARDGIISGGNPTQGIVNLGIPTLVNYTGSFFNYGVKSDFVDLPTAIANVWPQQVARLNGGTIRVLGVQAVPGTTGWLGSSYAASGMFTVRFTFNGLTWDALFVSGAAPIDFDSWLWYHSYIAVPVGGSQVIANALVNTWSTWDNSAANATRLQNALNTILTTVVPGNPIDSDVFDAIHQQWVDYIKQ